MPGVENAIASMKLKEQELEVVAHNISNSNTTGFKEERIVFERILKQQQAGAPASAEEQFELKARKVVDFRPGDIQSTSNPLDVALQGEGFFEVQSRGGTFYTRNGSFVLDEQARLVNQAGDVVMGSQGPIVLREGGKVDISESGQVTLNGEEVGQVKVVTFEDMSKLSPAGNTLFRAEEGALPKVATDVSVLQGKTETSNTNLVMGLVRLMQVAREYETYQRVLKNQGKMDEAAVSSLGRLS